MRILQVFGQPVRQWIHRIAVAAGTHPIVSGIAAVVSVLAGALASFFTGSIRGSLGLPIDPKDGSTFSVSQIKFSGEAAFFWFLVIGAAFLFAWSKYSDSSADNEHKESLNKKLHGLESMPPDSFLDQLAKEHVAAYKVVAQTKANAKNGRPSIAEYNAAALDLLKTLARTVQAYDGHIVGRNYRLGLLLFSRTDWDAEKLRQIVNLDHLSPGAQHGTLVAIPELTVLFPDASRINSLSKSFALPVHNPKSMKDNDNVLPGAPRCFVTQSPVECPSLSKMLADMERTFPDKNQTVALKDFFASDAHRSIRSFIALPVPANKWADAALELKGELPWGVVLIECNQAGVLEGSSGFFYPVVQPMLLLISELVAMRSLADI